MIAQQFTQQQLIAMLAWQVEMGADEAVLDKPSHDLQAPQSSDDIYGPTPTPVSVASQPPSAPTSTAPSASPALAPAPQNQTVPVHLQHVGSLSDLATALGQLDSCPLKHTASTMCFSDGNAGARLMIIGEAPGRDEDRWGCRLLVLLGSFLIICWPALALIAVVFI